MSTNMHKWLSEVMAAKIKKPMPILSFPSVQLIGATVKEIINNSDLQAEGMRKVAQRVDSLASVSFMDLSVEAEAFGSQIKVFENEVPTVVNAVVHDENEAKDIKVPCVGEARTGVYVESIKKAKALINDRPVFAGMIGPFSLAARLVDVDNSMIYCKRKPELMKILMEKTTEFLLEYAAEYKAAGADGILMAEPITGLLSPRLAAEFSEPYVKKISEEMKDNNFLMMYHNCGNTTIKMTDSIIRTGCDAYHFGDAIDMSQMLEKFPADTIVMGNIDPAGEFNQGTPESVRRATLRLLGECSCHSNFVISSGCDIPPSSRWENIDAFFRATEDFYERGIKL